MDKQEYTVDDNGFIHVLDATFYTPKNGSVCYVDKYWVVHKANHITFYVGRENKGISKTFNEWVYKEGRLSTQCNSNLEVCKKLWPKLTTRHYPILYLPMRY